MVEDYLIQWSWLQRMVSKCLVSHCKWLRMKITSPEEGYFHFIKTNFCLWRFARKPAQLTKLVYNIVRKSIENPPLFIARSAQIRRQDKSITLVNTALILHKIGKLESKACSPGHMSGFDWVVPIIESTARQIHLGYQL